MIYRGAVLYPGQAYYNTWYLSGEDFRLVDPWDAGNLSLDPLSQAPGACLDCNWRGEPDQYPFETVVGHARPDTQWTTTGSPATDRSEQLAH